MTNVITYINDFSSSWFDAMWAVIWQSTLLVIAVSAVLLVWRGLPPALRCWAWRIVAVKFLVLPIWIITIPLPLHPSAVPKSVGIASAAETANATFEEIEAPTTARQRIGTSSTSAISAAVSIERSTRLNWQAWLVAGWLVVIAIQSARTVWQRIQLRKLLATARPANEAILRSVVSGCDQLQLASVPEVLVTDVDVSPFVAWFRRPVLVLPAAMADTYNAWQLRQIVLHELAHVRRVDLLWCWITHVMRMVYWFHPVAHWVAFRESLERELACDEMAMTHSGATAADYARTLIEAASRLAQPAVFRAAAAAHLDGGVAIHGSHKAATTQTSLLAGGIQ
jgi:beta-lactamase regulating signal transducer with metallopeptidase domain